MCSSPRKFQISTKKPIFQNDNLGGKMNTYRRCLVTEPSVTPQSHPAQRQTEPVFSYFTTICQPEIFLFSFQKVLVLHRCDKSPSLGSLWGPSDNCVSLQSDVNIFWNVRTIIALSVDTVKRAEEGSERGLTLSSYNAEATTLAAWPRNTLSQRVITNASPKPSSSTPPSFSFFT